MDILVFFNTGFTNAYNIIRNVPLLRSASPEVCYANGHYWNTLQNTSNIPIVNTAMKGKD